MKILYRCFSFVLCFLIFSNSFAQVTQFPQVYNNVPYLGLSQNIRQGPSQSSTVIDLLGPNWNIGGQSLNTTGGDPDFKNWVKICLPSTSGTISYGYMACGEKWVKITETNLYATVTANNVNVRPCSTCNLSWVTINGQHAKFGAGSIVALTTGFSSNGYYFVHTYILKI